MQKRWQVLSRKVAQAERATWKTKKVWIFLVSSLNVLFSLIAQIKQELTTSTKQTAEVEQLKTELAAEKEGTEKLQAKIQSLMGDLSKLRAESNQEKISKDTNDKL